MRGRRYAHHCGTPVEGDVRLNHLRAKRPSPPPHTFQTTKNPYPRRYAGFHATLLFALAQSTTRLALFQGLQMPCRRMPPVGIRRERPSWSRLVRPRSRGPVTRSGRSRGVKYSPAVPSPAGIAGGGRRQSRSFRVYRTDPREIFTGRWQIQQILETPRDNNHPPAPPGTIRLRTCRHGRCGWANRPRKAKVKQQISKWRNRRSQGRNQKSKGKHQNGGIAAGGDDFHNFASCFLIFDF